MKKEPNLSRRILIYAVMTFCMTLLVWLAWNGTHDSDLHKVLAEGCFFTMGMVVAFYALSGNIDLGLNIIAARFGGQQQQPMRRATDAPRVPLRGNSRPDNYAPPPRRDPDVGIE